MNLILVFFIPIAFLIAIEIYLSFKYDKSELANPTEAINKALIDSNDKN